MPKRSIRRMDNKGSVAVEFAIVAPVIILIFVGIFELGMLELSRNCLELAAREASRIGITGRTPANTSREQYIKDTVQTITAGYFQPSRVFVTLWVYSSFNLTDPEPWTDTNHNGTWDADEPYTDVNKNGHWDGNMAASGAGGPGDVVRYRITASRPYLTPIWKTLMGDGDAHFMVEAVVKNE
ncbi:TadE/TadG family type IV pilus assembly protein [Azospirillum picis]|uniref:Flp pilus assembly protein TadG n=1 Tax=Azospirillum picis TaxID=488438 RepID=A0ABU0MP51_9PROT|nr:TadE/TadG family type IV pilus assembly protein [Azospirillum picis]MBP2301107.1 Flp pilus assembly protein TadG [Azospirillum picis]MDQ0534931.1 Flp pilus assembly protein TadG [Azospirillum picis]